MLLKIKNPKKRKDSIAMKDLLAQLSKDKMEVLVQFAKSMEKYCGELKYAFYISWCYVHDIPFETRLNQNEWEFFNAA